MRLNSVPDLVVVSPCPRARSVAQISAYRRTRPSGSSRTTCQSSISGTHVSLHSMRSTSDVAAEQLVEDGAAAEERLVVGGDLAGEVLDDPAGLTPLGAGPLDQDVLEVGLVARLRVILRPHAIGPGDHLRYGRRWRV